MKKICLVIFLIWVECSFAQELSIDTIDTTEVNVNRNPKSKKPKKIRRDTSEIIKQPLRVELKIEDLNDEFDVIDGYEKGLLIVQNTGESVPDGTLWQFHFVNNDLKPQWQVNQVVGNRSSFIGYDYNNGFYFLLFENSSRYREYDILVIDVEGRKSIFQQFSLPFMIDLKFFEALDNGILLVGNYNYRPVALIHDIVSGKPKVLPGFYNNNERVFDLVMDEENKAFSIVLAERMRNGKYTNRIKSFTYDGLLILENIINPGEDYNLVDGTTTNFGNGVQYMAGTYSTKASMYSRGIYISKFTNGQQRFLKNYNYGELSNFFSFRGERAASRLQRKTGRKKAKGKEPKFSYQLYIHEIVPKGDVNILIAEAYYAKYATGSSYGTIGMGYGPYSTMNSGSYNPYMQQRMFMGYKYTHAIIVAFDSKGDVIWDNSFKTNDITSYNLEKSVAVNVQGEKALIVYMDDGELKSKVVKGDEVLEGKTYNSVRLLNKGDKSVSRNPDIQGVRNWYENFLYSYGIQKIRNKTLPRPERKRRVFYINKIEFDEAAPEFPNIRTTSIR